MTKDKNLKNKQINGIWLGLFAIAISILPGIAIADSGITSEAAKIIGGIVVAWIFSLGLVVKKPREGLMLTAGLAALVSLYLGNLHFADGPALCDAGDMFSCSTVTSSEYSALFGVPIAFLGTGYYVAMLFLAYFSNTEEYKSVPQLLTIGGIFSVLYSVVLAYFSAVEVKAWCLFCISLYGFNVIALVGALLAQKHTEKVSLFAGKAFGNAVTILVVTVIISMAVFSESSEDLSIKASRLTMGEITEELPAAISFDGSEPRLGSSKAKIQVVEFADFECPHCAMVAPTLKKIAMSDLGVSLRFKQYPLSNICNPNVSSSAHENACQAAIATECAHKQKKFWELSRLVFKNQDYLARFGIFNSFAEQVGIDKIAFAACMDDPKILAGISSDIKAAEKAGVKGTPSIFLTGIDDSKKWYRLTGTPEDLLVVLSKLKTQESEQ